MWKVGHSIAVALCDITGLDNVGSLSDCCETVCSIVKDFQLELQLGSTAYFDFTSCHKHLL